VKEDKIEERPHPGPRGPKATNLRTVLRGASRGEGTPALRGLYPLGAGFPTPSRLLCGRAPREGEEEPVSGGASVSEVHAYPVRPEGFEESLFPTAASKRAVAEHLLLAPWLARASELEGCGGEVARAPGKRVEVEVSRGGAHVIEPRRGRRRVVEVLDSWREIRGWWSEVGVNRLVFRVALSGGAVVDLAREGSSGWSVVGVAD
jgi:hypothetical protein